MSSHSIVLAFLKVFLKHKIFNLEEVPFTYFFILLPVLLKYLCSTFIPQTNQFSKNVERPDHTCFSFFFPPKLKEKKITILLQNN